MLIIKTDNRVSLQFRPFRPSEAISGQCILINKFFIWNLSQFRHEIADDRRVLFPVDAQVEITRGTTARAESEVLKPLVNVNIDFNFRFLQASGRCTHLFATERDKNPKFVLESLKSNFACKRRYASLVWFYCNSSIWQFVIVLFYWGVVNCTYLIHVLCAKSWASEH